MEQSLVNRSVGSILRNKIISNISNILSECDSDPDSIRRLAIQGNCLELLAGLEEMIEDLGLDA